MQRKQEFESFYKEGLALALEYSEKERIIIFIQFILCIVLPIVFIPVCVIIYLHTKIEMVLLPALILLLGAPIYINYLLGDTIYYRNFKKKIIGRIIKYINPNLQYDNLRKVDDYYYFDAGFFTNQNLNTYGDDHVAGTINGATVEFSEYLAEFKSSKDKKEAGSEYQFRGLFFSVEFEKMFESEIILKSAGLPYSPDEEDVIIGHEAFDKFFYVKVPKWKDNISKVLSVPVINALLSVRENCPNEFMVSFKGNNFYLAMVYNDDLFEPSIFKTVKNYDQMFEYFEQLFYPILLVEEITKIFGTPQK